MHRPALAYVVNSLQPGGTEKLVVEMSLAFAAEFRVLVFCLDEPGLWAGSLRERGIPVYGLWRQPGLDLRLSLELARLFRRLDVRLIHAHQCTAWFYAALSRILCRRAPLLFEEHGRFFPEVDRARRRWVNRWLIKRLTRRVVAVCEDIRLRLERYEGLDRRSIEVIYNGVAVEPTLAPAHRQAMRGELGFDATDFVVGTVGRFDAIKNLPMLVHALNTAAGQQARLRGLLVGDGPERATIQALIERLGLGDRVRLTGFRQDARRLIQCLDLFVLSSWSEGTSMALLEAMAAGTPVAVSAVGGNPEIVVAGETGWVVPCDDAPALAAALLDASGEPSRRERFAVAAQRRFEERYTFERMIENYRGVYRALLGACR
ncbi:MAG: glycosyltransferase [Steroidobacteraceae bacterium]|nr:glycosyltransferase [Steroidobacteraceae bacterium]